MTRRVLPHALLGALLALVLLPLLTAAPASAARTITISLTANGPKPASAAAAAGDAIVFRNDDATFVHQARSKSTNWAFNTGPLAPGQQSPPVTLTKPGKYDYEGANLDTFTGTVVVPGGTTATAAPAPSRSAAPAPSRSASAAASPAASGSPSPTGGTGVVGPPPLAGGFGTIAVPASPGSGASPIPPALAPNVATTLAGEDVSSAQPSGSAVAIGSGRLPQPPTGRRYGLPAALAAVAAAGVASLLIRLLLAHPAAKRPRPDLPVTVD